jgi:hypothetical protein
MMRSQTLYSALRAFDFEGHLVSVKGDVLLDFRHCRVRIFVGPDRVSGGLSVGAQAEIIGVTLVGAMSLMFGARVMFNPNVGSRDKKTAG